MSDIQAVIGGNVRRIRRMRALSLDQLSALSGVSKGMLSQIENGDSSPTVSTLWKIANGLEVSFSSLIGERDSEVSIVRGDTVDPVTEDEELYRVFSYFPYDDSRKFEIYRMELLPGCRHVSERHHGGVEEYLYAAEGSLSVAVGGRVIHLNQGDAVRFRAMESHTYENHSAEKAVCHLLIYYP
ncbi:helix-turn-helix domain-containing protein [Bacillus mangrovi]|uniref:Helix-turn-helix domain-containing protein n=1 Tax=Metabacillus mangrovi TaxID=1491830 RepID=A0A7X2S4G8_9BACI|nr:XRE family transcriptional regulator [Metabacillus mangrovi]MTH53345.1 helix-turn-helix domain-containing protein [Metabacillus mangrovi]